MRVAELFLLAAALAMDAFAVAVGRGLCAGEVRPKHMLSCGICFGGFQALMPLIGYGLGVRFQEMIERYDHWLAFFLLEMIGIGMLRADGDGEGLPSSGAFAPVPMLLSALATSIDALAVGVTFAFLQVQILRASATIGLIACAFSVAGVWLGGRFGMRRRRAAERAGGAILMLMGLKILLEHLLE